MTGDPAAEPAANSCELAAKNAYFPKRYRRLTTACVRFSKLAVPAPTVAGWNPGSDRRKLPQKLATFGGSWAARKAQKNQQRIRADFDQNGRRAEKTRSGPKTAARKVGNFPGISGQDREAPKDHERPGVQGAQKTGNFSGLGTRGGRPEKTTKGQEGSKPKNRPEFRHLPAKPGSAEKTMKGGRAGSARNRAGREKTNRPKNPENPKRRRSKKDHRPLRWFFGGAPRGP